MERGGHGETAIEGVEGWLKANALALRVGKRDALPRTGKAHRPEQGMKQFAWIAATFRAPNRPLVAVTDLRRGW